MGPRLKVASGAAAVLALTQRFSASELLLGVDVKPLRSALDEPSRGRFLKRHALSPANQLERKVVR